MNLDTLLASDRVMTDLRASSKKQAIKLIADLCARVLPQDAASVLSGLQEREQISSTGVGNGVAIPHARLEGLSQVYGLFLRFNTPLSFAAIDDAPVDLVFVLLAPKDASAEHLKALALVSRCLRRKEMREKLRKAPDAAACLVILKNGST